MPAPAVAEQMPESGPEDKEREARERRAREERLQLLGSRLMGIARDRVTHRADLETRWLNDLRQYNSRYDAETEARLNEDPTASKVFVNLTRPKVKSAKSRLIETLFPSDERNWAIRPTPVPELVQAVSTGDATPVMDEQGLPVQGEDGEPLTESQRASQIIDEAKRRADAMEMEIEDQFEESDYYVACRDVIHDGVVLGTGILKGPVVVGRMREAWRTVSDDNGRSVQVLERVVDNRPAVFRVDPWDFYPDLSVSKLKDSESELERHWMSRKELARMVNDPGVLRDQVVELLKEDPRSFRTTVSWLQEMRRLSGVTASPQDDNRYEVWEYNGPIEKEDLIACGCEFIDDPDNPLEQYEGTVLFANNRVIKTIINPMDTDERPYSVWCWEGDDTSIFGMGVPYQLRHPQRVVNAAWRVTLENAALSSGPQIIIDRTKIEPADGNWRLTARKLWYTIAGKSVRMDDAFKTEDIPNRQADLMAIIAKAETFFELETNLPLVAQGVEQPGGTKTASGLSMLMNSANTTLRDPVKNFDDDVTTPVVKRFYDWNMQYSKKEHIKGDMEVRARGSSVLLVREMLAQNLMTLLATAGANPILAQLTKWAAAYRRVVSAMQIDTDDVVKSDDDLKKEAAAAAKNGGQQDIEQMKLAQMQQQHEDMMADRQAERASREQIAMLTRDSAMMKLANDLEVSLEKIGADLERARMAEQNRRDIHLSERDLRLTTGAGV